MKMSTPNVTGTLKYNCDALITAFQKGDSKGVKLFTKNIINEVVKTARTDNYLIMQVGQYIAYDAAPRLNLSKSMSTQLVDQLDARWNIKKR